MESLQDIGMWLIILHFVSAIVAAVYGENRTVGGGKSFLLYLFCPLVWLGVFITSKDKQDLG